MTQSPDPSSPPKREPSTRTPVPRPDLGDPSPDLRDALDNLTEAFQDLWGLRDACTLEGGPGDPTEGPLAVQCQDAMDALRAVLGTLDDVLAARGDAAPDEAWTQHLHGSALTPKGDGWTEGAWTDEGQPVLPESMPDFVWLYSDMPWSQESTPMSKHTVTSMLLSSRAILRLKLEDCRLRWFWRPLASVPPPCTLLDPETP